MPSPFPGMDPYLEGEVWSDVHQELAGELRRRLVPLVRPKYTARLVPRIVIEKSPEAEEGSMYPDFDVILAKPGWSAGPGESAATLTPATATVPMGASVRWKLVTVEVHHRGTGDLVTAIEVLSPVNKRRPGLLNYRRKRKEYWERGANLIEIDLLRRGTRPFRGPGMPRGDYYVCLTPAGKKRVDVWAMTLRDPLPTVPVPLLGDDGPAALDIGAALADAYDAAAYDLRVDYAADPPPPPLSDADRAWIAARLADRRSRSEPAPP